MLQIEHKIFHSRLFIGSAGFPDSVTRKHAIKASGSEVITVSIRRINLQNPQSEETLHNLLEQKLFLLPNTAGCYTAKEAILTAQLAREALNTHWIKLEVIGDEKTLYPDAEELLQAAKELIAQGFTVLPYCSDDLVLCTKLARLGCAAIMPLASPIGSGMGLNNPYNLALIRQAISLPLLIDAGIGTPSDVTRCMELGADGVLVNSAIARAQNPIQMAKAMRLACESGRLAHLSGRISKKWFAIPSSPLQGVVRCTASILS
ncbi:MAG: Thiazole synthase [Chlamydiales bacterium]|nr:Thiazole synthase [Chlamydiales bacterium]